MCALLRGLNAALFAFLGRMAWCRLPYLECFKHVGLSPPPPQEQECGSQEGIFPLHQTNLSFQFPLCCCSPDCQFAVVPALSSMKAASHQGFHHVSVGLFHSNIGVGVGEDSKTCCLSFLNSPVFSHEILPPFPLPPFTFLTPENLLKWKEKGGGIAAQDFLIGSIRSPPSGSSSDFFLSFSLSNKQENKGQPTISG